MLEGGRGVAKAKEHDCWLEQSFVSDEGRFPLVSILDANVVVPPLNTKLGKDSGIFDLVSEIRDKVEGVCIFNSVTIDVSIVLARSEGIGGVLFVDEKEGCSLRGVRGVNPS